MTRPFPLDKLAFALTIVAAVAFSLIRVNLTDTPWHLATARYAFQTGAFPATNTFSFTHPDYPLYQQYPAYQAVLYAAYMVAGWEGLSLLHCLGWVSVFLLWIRWGGTWRQAMVLHLPWMFCLWCLQQRMILRPDLATCLLFLAQIHVIDCYRKGCKDDLGSAEGSPLRIRVMSGPRLILALVPIQWLMANSHQLFTVGLAAQAIFAIHLAMVRTLGGRLGISRSDRDLPLWPVLMAFAGSMIVCLLTPLGIDVLNVAAHTAGSLAHHRDDVTEFAYFYASNWTLALTVISAAFGVTGFWLSRRDWQPMEVGLWLMGAALVAAAMRGLVFFAPLSVGIFARAFARRDDPQRQDAPAESSELTEEEPRKLTPLDWARLAMVGVTFGLALLVITYRWIKPSRTLGGTQPGLGRSLGDWPEPTIAFLRRHPPPGRMLNLGWYSGNALIWGLFPGQRVFVDPRFEAYPREFLVRAIQAERDDTTLQALIDEYEPTWIAAEVRLPAVMQRVRNLLDAGGWQLVHGDTNLLVLVRDVPETAPYLGEHMLPIQFWRPADWLSGHPDLLRLQYLRMAEAYENLGLGERAAEMEEKAAGIAEANRRLQ